MKFIRQILAVLFLFCAAAAHADPVEGSDYTVFSPAMPTHTGNKIEVIEFFFYGCPHCYKLNPLMQAWEKKLPKDVQLVYVPAVFNPTWEVSARTFYALEAMGLRKQLHDDIFNAWNDNILLTDEQSTEEFLAKHGVDRKKFNDAYNSFSMQSQVLRAKQMGQLYAIRGTPSLVIDGKFLLTGLPPDETMQALNFLVDKARRERAPRK